MADLSALFQIQTTTWRGQEFLTRATEYSTGRQLVVHSYPFSDDPDIEDMGRRERRITFEAFLNGDDITDQANLFVDLAEMQGEGELTHPFLGLVFANCASANFRQSVDDTRSVSLRLEFIIPRQDSSATNTQDDPDTEQDTLRDSDDLDDAADDDFWQDAADAVGEGLVVVGDVSDTVLTTVNEGLEVATATAGTIQGVLQDGAYVVTTLVGAAMTVSNLAIGAVNDAARAANAVQGLDGVAGTTQWFGRYDQGNLMAQPTAITSATFTGTPQQRTAQAAAILITQSTQQRASVLAAANALPGLAQTLHDSTSSAVLCQGIQTLTEAVRTSSLAPLDAIRLLAPLCQFQATPQPDTSTVATAATVATQAFAARIRRAAIASVARATTQFNPQTQTDVQTVFSLVTPLFDQEIATAADAGDDESYRAVESLKLRVVRDLQTREVNLPVLQQITLKANLPSLALAFQQYGDATRADELVTLNNPANPLLMPTTVTVMSQ